MLYFKVKIGFELEDIIGIDETEYPTVFKAQVTGKIAVFKNGMSIGGNSIISIKPDWLKMTGYELDDMTNIKEFQDQRKKCIEEVRQFLEKTKLELQNGGGKLLT